MSPLQADMVGVGVARHHVLRRPPPPRGRPASSPGPRCRTSGDFAFHRAGSSVRFMNEAIAPPIPGYVIYDPVDPFENRAGPFFWARLPDGTHSFAMTAAERHCNSQGIVHGGLLMTMIDLALVITAKSAPGEQLVTVSLNSEFLSSARAGDLIEARGELLRRTRSLAFVRGQISCGDQTLLVASAVLKLINAR
jgi:uncharacterized protein (TIGR00369 family)